MNETEWLDYFETINNRKPSEEEIQQAKANGEFIASEPVAENSQPQVQVSGPVTGQGTPVVAPKKGLSKKVKIIIASVIGAVVLLALSFGGYAYIHLQGGKISEGTYQIETYRYYDKDKKKMIDGMESYEKSKLKDGDFVKVKGDQLKFYNYTLAGAVNLVDFTDYDTEKAFRLDNWSRTLTPTMSLADYTKVVEKAVDNRYKVDEYTTKSDIDDSKKVYIKDYKKSLKETVHYKVNGDKIIVLIYDKKGKLSEEKVFKRLTKEEEKKLDYEYERDVRADKKLFHS